VRAKMKKDYTMGSGNVFADLELPNPEERLAKARLAIEIGKLITARRLTQAEAGRRLGIDQPRISKLMRGHLADFSTSTLMKYLTVLGCNVELVVQSRPRAKGPGHLRVRYA